MCWLISAALRKKVSASRLTVAAKKIERNGSNTHALIAHPHTHALAHPQTHALAHPHTHALAHPQTHASHLDF